MDYAIFRTGGKQYKAQPGTLVDVGKLAVEAGTTMEFDQVLMISRDGQMVVGQPVVVGARVIAEVQSHGRAPKITVFKYKPKTRYQVTRGHRSHYTRLAVQEILMEGEEGSGTQKSRRKRTKREGQQVETPRRQTVRRTTGRRREHTSETAGDPDTARS